ncbi:Membrane proteins related to metalloendopeptidases [hydrothermal vent metagenome]|uniref:Membrane proteins related to metalloendopeptidases n=1 Tax=hydrothermal vent metagenome TaxID=652676 RepID=A0A3B1AAD7_9ZZZZ
MNKSYRKILTNKYYLALIIIALVLLIGLILPEDLTIPVDQASTTDWNHQTFWHEPWGASGVHKGIDIFAPGGRNVISATYGVVIYKANLRLGGNVVAVLGPKWRIHYYAHMAQIDVGIGSLLNRRDVIGTVGDTGNAKGKPPHLHYSIITLLPYLTRWDRSTQGWLKMFFLDPSERLLVEEIAKETGP